MLDKTEISEVPFHKLLGVTLDDTTSYDSHIDEPCKLKAIQTLRPL